MNDSEPSATDARRTDIKLPALKWFGALGVAIALIIFLIYFVDEPVARFFSRHWRLYPLIHLRIGASVLVGLIFAGALGYGLSLLAGGASTRFARAIILAAYSSLSAFSVNFFLLKRLFGREDVHQVLHDSIQHGFFLVQQAGEASFPSGHSVITAAILTVLWRFYPKWHFLYVALAVIGAFMLMAGGWHFLSDIVAGGLFGTCAGLTTVRLWHAISLNDSESS